MICFLPHKGLGNRFEAMMSALQWSKDTGCPVHFIWIRERKMNCRFDRLFEPIPNLREMGKIGMRIFQTMNHQRNILSKLGIYVFDHKENEKLMEFLNQRRNGGKTVVFALSYSKFYEGNKLDFNDIFHLRADMLAVLNQVTSNFTDSTIGIHIRRTDHEASIKYSPLEAFEDRIEKEIERNPRANFYVASDSPETIEELKNKYGGRILNNPGPLERGTEAGIRHAVIEMFTLARCKCIWGSCGSTYSQWAARIGKIPLETILPPNVEHPELPPY